MILLWGKFLICLAVIMLAGTVLSQYGDILAEKTGMGRTWIGVILLAAVTSLPELFSGVSAAAIAEAPNLVLGSILGSCVFNLALIVLIDFTHRKGTIYTTAAQGHILSAGFGMLMIAVVGFSIVQARTVGEIAFGRIGLTGPLALVVYLLAMRMLYKYEREIQAEAPEALLVYKHVSTATAAALFSLAAAVVVAAAIWLPLVCDELAAAMGWNQSFVGTLLIALATSAPELVVTVAAVRLGALDLAMGNVLGSNLFNIAILCLIDPFFAAGPMLSHVSLFHTATAFSGVIMSALVVIGLFYRPRRRVLRTVSWISFILAAIFVLNSVVLYLAKD